MMAEVIKRKDAAERSAIRSVADMLAVLAGYSEDERREILAKAGGHP
jgi:hypothetical protein